MVLLSVCMGVPNFGPVALIFWTLLDVTEGFIVYSHESGRRPTRCIPVALDFERANMGVNVMSIWSLSKCVTPIFGLRNWKFRRCLK